MSIPNFHTEQVDVSQLTISNDHKNEVIIDHAYTETELKSLSELRQLVITHLKTKSPRKEEADVQHWMIQWKNDGFKHGECGYSRRHARLKDIATWENKCAEEDQEKLKTGIPLHPSKDPEIRISHIPNYELYRFLKARKMKVVDAADMYFNYLNWYDQYGVADLARFQDNPYHMPVAKPLRSVCSWLHHGYDKQGRPIYLEKIGIMDCYRFNELMSRAEVAQTHIWFLEYCRLRCEQASRRSSKRIDQVIQILDMAGLGMGHRQMIKYFKATTITDQSYYPETLGAMYMINCPRIFHSIWQLCQPFLEPVTKQKIKILGKDMKQLVDDLGAENLPVEYGGTCTEHPTSSHPICMPDLIPLPDLDCTNDSTEKFEEKDILAGDKHMVEMKIMEKNMEEYGEIRWQFKVVAKDISFHAEWYPQDGSPLIEIHPPTRISHDPLFTPGFLDITSPGILRLIWDNSFSRFTSKKIIYRVYRVTPLN